MQESIKDIPREATADPRDEKPEEDDAVTEMFYGKPVKKPSSEESRALKRKELLELDKLRRHVKGEEPPELFPK